MDICLQGEIGLIICTDSVSEELDSEVGAGQETKEEVLGPWLEQTAKPDICLTNDTELVIANESVSNAWDFEPRI